MPSGSTSTISIIVQAIDDASAQLAGLFDGVSAKSTAAQEAVTKLGEQMTIAGAAMAGIGAAITGAFSQVVSAAADQQEAQSALATTVANQVSLANQGTAADSGAASEKQFLIDKINAYQAQITAANAQLQNFSGTTAEVTARQTTATAAIATAQDNLAKYQGQLQQLMNQQSLAGQSASTLTAALTATAQSGVALGFSFTDSLNAMKTLFTETGSVSESQQAFSAAMDLARFKNEDLGTAVQQVEMALQGQGRSLATLGIQIKDGLTPMQALAALQDQLQGQAKDYAETVSGKEAVAQAQFNEALAQAGTTILPILTVLLTDLSQLVTVVGNWAAAHPKLTEAILVSVGVFGALLLVLGSIMLLVGPLLIAFGTMGGIVAIAGVGIAAAIAVVVAAIVLLVQNWQSIVPAVQVAWETIKNLITNNWQAIVQVLLPGVGSLVVFLFDNWNTIKSDVETAWNWIATFIQGIWAKIVSSAQTAIGTIQNLINSIMAPINALTSAANNISGGIGSFATSAIKAFAAGGIVTSPQLALVGEAGPEAIIPLSAFNGGSSLTGGGGIGGPGNIVINITGGNFLNQGGAQQIAQALATMIGRQIKLSTI